MSIEQARRLAMETSAAMEGGINPAEQRRTARGERTFGDLFKDYMDRHAKVNKRTWKEDQYRYDAYLTKPLGSKKISAVDRHAIAAVHSAITRGGHATLANRVLALVSSVFGWGISVGLCEANPAHGIKHNPEKSRDRFLQASELPGFFQSLAEEPNETIRDYLLLSLLTGARRSNVLVMRWADINLDAGEWRIELTKNGTPQTVTLTPEAIEICKRLDTAGQLKGAAKKARTEAIATPEAAVATLRELADAADVPLDGVSLGDLRIHDLRRTLGSWQAKTGASLSIIGKSLNHKSQATTAIYARLDLDPVRESMQRATAAMLTAAGMKDSAKVVKLAKIA